MEAWERAWLDMNDWCEEQMDCQAGVFSGLCQMDVLDGMDPADFIGWYNRKGAS